MAKFCSNCGKQLDENAAMCLNCGVLVGNTTSNNLSNPNSTKKAKKKGFPTWVIVLIVVGCFILIPLILVTIIAVTAFNVVGDVGIDNLVENIVQKGTIGDTLKTDEFRIILTDALIYSSIGEEENYKEIPAEGKEYLVFFFNVENISDESEYISSYNFSGYADGYTVSVEYLFNDIDGVEKLGADLSPGMKTKGYVAFEVDTSWQKFELHFNDFSNSEEELVFTVVNEDNSNVEGA